MSMALGASIPEELIEETLLRLSVKSLLRFKTASKKWHSLISKDDKFAKFHLKKYSSSKNLFLYHSNSCCDDAEFKYSDIDSDESRKISFVIENFVKKDSKACRLIGSANGLICVAASFEVICFIWNPCSCECKSISLPVEEDFIDYRLFGFGYDLVSDDYKILGDWDSCFQVFSLKTNSWKKILDYDTYKYGTTYLALYSNGALHWTSIGPKITAFDLSKDQILFLDLPQGISKTIYQGSLCAFDQDSLVIWVMKEYGNSKSWAKLYTLLPPILAKPIGISRLGEVAFNAYAYAYAISGIFKFNIQDKIMSWPKYHYLNPFAYQESLISPRCFDLET